MKKFILGALGLNKKKPQPTDPAALLEQYWSENRAEGMTLGAMFEEVKNRPPTSNLQQSLFVSNLMERIFQEEQRLLEKGSTAEADGNLPEAIKWYELCVAEQVSLTAPYKRLRIIYTKRKDYDHALRICEAAITRFKTAPSDDKDKWHHHKASLQAKLEKQA